MTLSAGITTMSARFTTMTKTILLNFLKLQPNLN